MGRLFNTHTCYFHVLNVFLLFNLLSVSLSISASHISTWSSQPDKFVNATRHFHLINILRLASMTLVCLLNSRGNSPCFYMGNGIPKFRTISQAKYRDWIFLELWERNPEYQVGKRKLTRYHCVLSFWASVIMSRHSDENEACILKSHLEKRFWWTSIFYNAREKFFRKI